MNFPKHYAGFICLCLFFAKAFATVGKQCDPEDTIDSECAPNSEQCDESGTCQCLPEFTIEKGVCMPPRTTPNYSSLVDNQGSGSLIAGIFIPLVLIAFVIFSIYVGKRFELVKWLRHRFSQRNSNYDEFMIGQDDDDDPPLA